MDFDATSTVRSLSTLPPEPPKPRERSAWSVVPRVVGSAAASVLGSVADVAKAFGAASAQTMESDPLAVIAVGRDRTRAGAEEGRRQIAEGEEFISGPGESFRAVRRDLRPDPATASTAERLVFGVGEPLLTLIGGALTMGPAGLVAAGAQQGMQQADDLREQGVDRTTRAKVGTLTAGATVAGAALPLAGSTLARTAGLYALGGPGAFVAQQAATREILRQADYAEIAEQFDPTDPLGLAISALVPLPFAAYGAARNIRAMRAPKPAPDAASAAEPVVPPEVADAAMVQNITTLSDAQAMRAMEPPELSTTPAQREAKSQVQRLSEYAEQEGERIGGVSHLRGMVEQLVKVYVNSGREAGRAMLDDHALNARLDSNFAYEVEMPGFLDELDAELAKSAESFVRDNSGRFDPASASLTDPPPLAGLPPTQTPALGTLTDAYQTARTRTEPRADDAPEVANIVTGLREAGDDPRRVAAFERLLAQEARTGKSPVDATADAVEGMRAMTDEQITGTDRPPKPAPDVLMQSVADRVMEVETLAPNLKVTDDATAVEFMAAARREAAEGTDAELGSLDADLVRVAADCALSTGSV